MSAVCDAYTVVWLHMLRMCEGARLTAMLVGDVGGVVVASA